MAMPRVLLAGVVDYVRGEKGYISKVTAERCNGQWRLASRYTLGSPPNPATGQRGGYPRVRFFDVVDIHAAIELMGRPPPLLTVCCRCRLVFVTPRSFGYPLLSRGRTMEFTPAVRGRRQAGRAVAAGDEEPANSICLGWSERGDRLVDALTRSLCVRGLTPRCTIANAARTPSSRR